MEKKRLLGSSDSDDAYSIGPFTLDHKRKKRQNYVVQFKQIIKVIKSGNVEDVRKILKKRSLELTDPEGLTVVHVATATNNRDVLSCLLEDKRCSSLMDNQDKEGFTPLLGAVMVGSYDTLDLLCSRGADACKTILKYGNVNVLHLAARKNDRRAAEIVLKYNSTPELINAFNENGDTPLVETVYLNSELMRVLLKAGADIKTKNPANGRTVLHVIVTFNRLHMLKDILGHPKATIDFAEIKDIKDDTALMIAVKLNNFEIVKSLVERYESLTGFNEVDQESVFHIAVRNGQDNILKALLNSRCIYCVDYLDNNYRTPLLYAAELNTAECLRELVENGADCNVRNSDTGETFVHVIARYFSNSTLSYIMSIPDISWFFTQSDNQGNTPYMTAIIEGNDKFLSAALKIKQVDLCDQNSEGEAPVYYVAKHGHVQTMRTLLMSPKYYSYIGRKGASEEELMNRDEVLRLEMIGALYATDVFLLFGIFIKHPLTRWFPAGLLTKTRHDRNVFHACAIGGNIEGLTLVYDMFNLFLPDTLHEMFDQPGLLGNTPLLFAAQCGIVSISCVFFFVTHGADLAAVNDTGLNFFNAVITYNPEAAESLINSMLDTCVAGKREHYNKDRININVDFSMICPKNQLSSQMDVVNMLFDEMSRPDCSKAKRQVLQHPVIELFLKSKQRAQRHYFTVSFVLLLILTNALSFFLLPIIHTSGNSEKNDGFLNPLIEKLLFIVFFLLSCVMAIIKIPNIITKKVWMTDAITFVPLIIITALLVLGRTFVLFPEMSAILILCCWIHVMIFFTTFYSVYSVQLAVFFHILSGISNHLIVLTTSMFAFALSFYCIYYRYEKFSSVPRSVIYTFIVIFLGYYPDLPTFEKEYFTSTPITFELVVECFLLGAFTFIIVFGVINMLIGLSVRSGNVAELDGKIYRHHQQVHFLYMIEYWCNNKFYWWLLKKGIFADALKRLRELQRIKINVGIYKEESKDFIDEASIRQFRSIVFIQNEVMNIKSEGSGNDYSQDYKNKSLQPIASQFSDFLIRRQAMWEEKQSALDADET